MNTEPQTTSPFQEFLTLLEKESSAERKLRLALDFMRESLSQSSTPRFKDFWEAKRVALPLFKENLSPKARSLLWAEYHELSNEARRIKEILDDQSSFAVEQIDLALKAVEEELEHYQERIEEMPELFFPRECRTLSSKRDLYSGLQRELTLLGTLAMRIQALRKELMKTEMRIRDKNKLFSRLSAAGDKVFPRRKELIQNISDEFKLDVENFVLAHFGEGEQSGAPSFALREEIKMMQAFAKELTLNTAVFTETRLKLSSCWDKLKEEEGERKKEIAEKREIVKQEREKELAKERAFREKINLVKSGLQTLLDSTNELDSEQIAEKSEALKQEYAALTLSKIERQLFDRLFKQIKDLIAEKKGKALLSLSKDDLDAIEKLEALLEETRVERQEIKGLLEQYRKTLGGSNLDFEKAMTMQEMMESEKERLEKTDAAIIEIEEKINEISS